MAWQSHRYESKSESFPYTFIDLKPFDTSSDTSFYQSPRFVTHIDENAISLLGTYYDQVLPRKGKILDFCSSWISHYPKEFGDLVDRGDLKVFGLGMNEEELKVNPLLGSRWKVSNLNDDPQIKTTESLDAATCTVSIDYLTKPVEVLKSLRMLMKSGSWVHLAISNRCFPTKVVGRWLNIDENERLIMVGDYLWFSGWKEIEILTLCKGGGGLDPLWIVRGMK